MGITFPKIPKSVISEVTGTIVALPMVWIVGAWSPNEMVSTILIVIIDTIPAVAVLVLLEMRIGGGFLVAIKIVVKKILGAELLDSFLLRPALLHAGGLYLGAGKGGVVGSLAADFIYWVFVNITERIVK